MTSTSSGILKYSIVLANAKEFGGMIHSLPIFVTKLSFLKIFGSTIPEFTFVKILNSFETLASYPYEDNPKDIFQNQWFNTIFDKYEGKLNMLLSGETLNPPVDVQDTLVMSGEFPPDRNHKAARVFSSWSYNEFNRYEFRPFRNINKKELASWVKQLGLMKTLFPVTETCELEDVHYDMYSEMFNIEYKNPGIEPCRRCWPCREKWWAYGYYDFMVEEGQ
jgi:hypothetical protein